MRNRLYLDRDWDYVDVFDEKYISEAIQNGEVVTIPHTVAITPYDYFDEEVYQKIVAYQKHLFGDPSWEGKKLILTFEGAAHKADVYVNGKHTITHENGYTAFSIDVTNLIKIGDDNLITVKLDSRETLNQPPFGYVIDYMTYGGIYRDVYLEAREKFSIEDVFFQPSLLLNEDSSGKKGLFKADIILSAETKENLSDSRFELALSLNEKEVMRKEIKVEDVKKSCNLDDFLVGLKSEETICLKTEVDVIPWSTEKPNVYKGSVSLYKDGELLDEVSHTIGFRNVEFRADGFYLNGEKLKIRGLNRHQSYPYVGYAMPKNMQRHDADILKYELGVNAVRTSHYPQSQYFIEECDITGLLVFTEIPGWQHIGKKDWQDKAVRNVVEMVTQYRNHPSIMIWGVRINESEDNDEFYARTNAVCHIFDGTRQTGGVRCRTADKNTNIQEDVFTYNDFVHSGNNEGCLKKNKSTNDMSKPYLVTEYNGHMYPTKAFDWEEHRREHVLRHANVLDAIASEDDICGSFGWCMFDYNTHKDFGSGDRICYHGVMDMYRNPKMASYVYAAENSLDPILEVTSSMDIGEHPASNRGDCYIISNADSVKMYKNGRFLKEYFPADGKYKALKHGPILIDDYIGNDLVTEEGMKEKQADICKHLLNSYSLYNGKMTKMMMWDAIRLVLFYHMNPADAVPLYQKYIGNWGEESTEYRFDAIKDGKVILSKKIAPMKEAKLDVTYDCLEIRVKAVDENKNQLYFYNEPLTVTVDGPAEIVGPQISSIRGGMTGVYLKSVGKSGKVKVTLQTEHTKPVVVYLEAECEGL